MKKGRCKRHALNDSIYMKQPETVTRLDGTGDCRSVGREVASLLRGCRAVFCLV